MKMKSISVATAAFYLSKFS